MNHQGHLAGVISLYLSYLIKTWMKSPYKSRTQSQYLSIILYHFTSLYTIFAGAFLPDLDLALGKSNLLLLKTMGLTWVPYLGSILISRISGVRGSVHHVRGLGRVENTFLLVMTILVMTLLVMTWLRIKLVGCYNGYSHRESFLHNNWIILPMIIYFISLMELKYMGDYRLPPFDLMIVGFYLVGLANHKTMDSISTMSSSMVWTYPGGVLGALTQGLIYGLFQHYLMECILTPYIYFFLRLF